MSIPWLRLYTETLSDRKIKLISVELDLPKPLVIGVWVSILMLAGESPDRGRLISSRGNPWPEHFICDEIGIDNKTFSQIMTEFMAFDMVFVDDEGVFCITKWDERQFKSDNSYERVKKFRAKKAKQGDKVEGNVTDNSNDYTKRNVSSNDNETFQETDQIHNTDTNTDSKEGEKSPHQKPATIPAYKIHAEETKTHCLTKVQIATLKEVIGTDPPKLERWREVCHAWAMQANKPNNLTGLLNWFNNGIPDYAREGYQNNGQSPKNRQTGDGVSGSTAETSKLGEQLSAAFKSRARTAGS